jgi:hypothetical protein
MKLTLAMIDRILAGDSDTDTETDSTVTKPVPPASKPIDIPKGTPNEYPNSIWEQDIKSDYFPSPWDKRDTVPQPMEYSPARNQDIPRQVRVRKTAIPLVKAEQKTEEYKEEVRVQKVPSPPPLFTLPKISLRLMAVMTLLSKTALMHEVVNIPVELFNPWGDEIIRIKRKQHSKQELTCMENTLLTKHLGFMYTESFQNMTKFLMSRTYITTYSCTEVMTVTPHVRNHPHFCQQCDIVHTFMPEQCRTIRKHGPRQLSMLSLDMSWKEPLKAVVVGSHELFYLPEDLKRTVLNLGTTSRATYSVPLSLDQLEQVLTGPDSLYSLLMRIITLLGKNSTFPIYVEFYTSKQSERQAIIYHILGFLQVLKVVQESYSGPLVALVASASPLACGNQDAYWAVKTQQLSLQMMSYFLGYAFGVPVGMIPLQQMVKTDNNQVVRHDHWEEEPIYSSNGVKTREFYGRLSYYLTLATTFIQQTEDKCLIEPSVG